MNYIGSKRKLLPPIKKYDFPKSWKKMLTGWALLMGKLLII